jgi:hypothetical protein
MSNPFYVSVQELGIASASIVDIEGTQGMALGAQVI